MNLSEAIFQVRSTVSDPTVDRYGKTVAPGSLTYSDATITSLLDQRLRSLSRTQVTRDAGYHNFSLALNSTSARQLFQNTWQWALPSWVAKVASVYSISTSGPLDPATQPTFSPYLWSRLANPSLRVPKLTRNAQYPGWTWEGNRTFRMWNSGSAPSLLLQVAKTPARLFRATVDRDPTAPNTVFLPSVLELGEMDLEEGGYINSEIQVTSGLTLENVGLIQRCVYSTTTNLGGEALPLLYSEANFAQQLDVGDKIESRIPLGDEHTRLLVLQTAQACFELTSNIPAQQAIADELRKELEEFKLHVTPRDTQGPEFVQTGEESYSAYDPDRAWGYRGVNP